MTVSRHIVKIGGGHVAIGDCRMETVLGSCLGIVLVWREMLVFGLAHVVLPKRPGADDMRYTRYGDAAVPYLLRRMGVPTEKWRDVRAVLAGGSEMYEGMSKPVGDENFRAVRTSLRSLGIRVVGMDVGGHAPRRLIVDGSAGVASSLHISAGGEPNKEQTWKLTF